MVPTKGKWYQVIERQGFGVRICLVNLYFVTAVITPALLPLKVKHDVHVFYESRTFSGATTLRILAPCRFMFGRFSLVTLDALRLKTSVLLISR